MDQIIKTTGLTKRAKDRVLAEKFSLMYTRVKYTAC